MEDGGRMIEPHDIRIDVIKRNFVKLTHIPSSIVVTKHNKSQCKAKAEAIEELTMLVELWKIESEVK